jgi:type VI secretion system protein ImpA
MNRLQAAPAKSNRHGERVSLAERPISHAEISSRQDVSAALERIITYFEIYEPGHPAPIFLSRAKRMLGVSFEELMTELFPEPGSLMARLNGPRSLS